MWPVSPCCTRNIALLESQQQPRESSLTSTVLRSIIVATVIMQLNLRLVYLPLDFDGSLKLILCSAYSSKGHAEINEVYLYTSFSSAYGSSRLLYLLWCNHVFTSVLVMSHWKKWHGATKNLWFNDNKTRQTCIHIFVIHYMTIYMWVVCILFVTDGS